MASAGFPSGKKGPDQRALRRLPPGVYADGCQAVSTSSALNGNNAD
jgi:hypothetical protein